MALATDILQNVCTTEQLRLLSWCKFFDLYLHLLDDDQLRSYMLDMTDSETGGCPPPLESHSFPLTQ